MSPRYDDEDDECCPNCGNRDIVGMCMPGVIECDECGFKGYVNMRRWRYSRDKWGLERTY